MALLSCEAPVIEPEEEEAPLTIRDVWNDVSGGTKVTLDEVVVTSGRVQVDTHFFVQDPRGGDRSGLRVDLGGALATWPPEVGTPVTLTGTVSFNGGRPYLTLNDDDDGEVLGEPVAPRVRDWNEDADLDFALVRVPDLMVTSAPDPAGRADTNHRYLGFGEAFGVQTPGWLATGELVGIVTDPDRLSPRTELDWTGPFEGEPPVSTTIAGVHSGAWVDGTPVVLTDVVQATPWSRCGRYAVLQHHDGTGVWLDVEAWGTPATEQGDLGAWYGEVRSDDEGLRLRMWEDPELAGTREVVVATELADGALVQVELSGLSGPDEFGEWIADGGLVVDDRFLDLSALPDPVTVLGAVREHNDGQTLVAPIEIATE